VITDLQHCTHLILQLVTMVSDCLALTTACLATYNEQSLKTIKTLFLNLSTILFQRCLFTIYGTFCSFPRLGSSIKDVRSKGVCVNQCGRLRMGRGWGSAIIRTSTNGNFTVSESISKSNTRHPRASGSQ